MCLVRQKLVPICNFCGLAQGASLHRGEATVKFLSNTRATGNFKADTSNMGLLAQTPQVYKLFCAIKP